jgi:hypothetical protein
MAIRGLDRYGLPVKTAMTGAAAWGDDLDFCHDGKGYFLGFSPLDLNGGTKLLGPVPSQEMILCRNQWCSL